MVDTRLRVWAADCAAADGWLCREDEAAELVCGMPVALENEIPAIDDNNANVANNTSNFRPVIIGFKTEVVGHLLYSDSRHTLGIPIEVAISGFTTSMQGLCT